MPEASEGLLGCLFRSQWCLLPGFENRFRNSLGPKPAAGGSKSGLKLSGPLNRRLISWGPAETRQGPGVNASLTLRQASCSHTRLRHRATPPLPLSHTPPRHETKCIPTKTHVRDQQAHSGGFDRQGMSQTIVCPAVSTQSVQKRLLMDLDGTHFGTEPSYCKLVSSQLSDFEWSSAVFRRRVSPSRGLAP